MIPKPMHIRTRVHTLQEGWDLCRAIMRKGYEGVQNDSARYNDIMLASEFMQNGLMNWKPRKKVKRRTRNEISNLRV